mmetsp:Transcript_59318/g.120581  ORF Transcript_59318/g.120581 Transcript_59318/m.120581 type:complete len:153 (-) Transcript_59318:171-629(-)
MAAAHSRCRGARQQSRLASLPSGREGGNANPSFDSEDDLDRGLAEELDRLVHPEKMQQLASHLDLMWKIGGAKKRDRPQVCSSCSGSGECECPWCHGTGVLTLGDSLVCSTTNHASKCPVCKSAGYTKCENCRGTGFRAGWLESDVPYFDQN